MTNDGMASYAWLN